MQLGILQVVGQPPAAGLAAACAASRGGLGDHELMWPTNSEATDRGLTLILTDWQDISKSPLSFSVSLFMTKCF